MKNRRRCCIIFLLIFLVGSAITGYAQPGKNELQSGGAIHTFEEYPGTLGEVNESSSEDHGSDARAGLSAQIYCKEYYRSQLSSLAQMVYDSLRNSPLSNGPAEVFIDFPINTTPELKTSFFTTVTVTRTDKYSYSYEYGLQEIQTYVQNCFSPAFYALGWDHSEMSWITGVKFFYEYGTSVPMMEQSTPTLAIGETRQIPNTEVVIDSLGVGYDSDSYDMMTKNPNDFTPPNYDFANTGNLADINRTVGNAVSQIGSLQGLSRAEQLKRIHDWLCLHVKYADNTRYPSSWRGYGTSYCALADGEAVCNGYSHAFKLLCEAYDIPCLYVKGYGNGGLHAWNEVEIDGQWYAVDVTWGDLITSISYEYFLAGSSTFSTDHLVDMGGKGFRFQVPALCSDTYDPAGSVDVQPPGADTLISLNQNSSLAVNLSYLPALRMNVVTGKELNVKNSVTGDVLFPSFVFPDSVYAEIVTRDNKLKSSGEPLSTGDKIVLRNAAGELLEEACVVIAGDVLGTGSPSIAQVVRLAQALTGARPLEGAFLAAGRITGGAQITIADAIAITKICTAS